MQHHSTTPSPHRRPGRAALARARPHRPGPAVLAGAGVAILGAALLGGAGLTGTDASTGHQVRTAVDQTTVTAAPVAVPEPASERHTPPPWQDSPPPLPAG